LFSRRVRLSARLKTAAVIASELLKLGAAVYTLLSVLGISAALSAFWPLLHPFAPALGYAFLGSLGTALTFVWFLVRRPTARRLLRGYRWIRAEYCYSIDSQNTSVHAQRIRITLEAIRPGVNYFENRYLWSGRGDEGGPEVVSSGHRLQGSAWRRGVWNHYYVHLGRSLAVGEREDVEILQRLHDTGGAFEPFLAKTILEPVDYLILRVLLPHQLLPRKINVTEGSSAVPTDVVVKQLPFSFDADTGEIRAEIPSPVFLHRYEIRWEY